MSNFGLNKKKHDIHTIMKVSNIIIKDKNGKEINKRNIDDNKKE